MKVVKGKPKGRGNKKPVNKMVKVDSFFNFFSPPEPSKNDDDDEASEITLASLICDFLNSFQNGRQPVICVL